MGMDRAYKQAESKMNEIRALFRRAEHFDRTEDEPFECLGQVRGELRALVHGRSRSRDPDEPYDRIEAILIGGGPSLLAVAELNDEGRPRHARLMVQDWGEP